MFRPRRFLFPLAAIALLVATAGCRSGPGVTEPPRLPSVTGTISLDGATTVPENATLAVRLVDIERTGPSRVVVEQIVSAPDKFPFRYRLHYNQNTIDYSHDYGIETVVTVNGRAIWSLSDPNPVLTKNRPVVANIVLHRSP